MPKRCARCGSISRARELVVPADWLDYLEDERGLSRPVGTLKMPLCGECHPEAERLREEGYEEFLDEVRLDALIDEGT